ncbi:unnamed protein product [Sphagnum tenellum]
MIKHPILSLVAVLLAAALGGEQAAVQAAVVKYDWTVDYLFAAPDCVERLIIAINGQFPSPTIQAVQGDTVVVNLKNNLPTEGVTIHWHGISQKGTPFSDGAAFVSQCPINPGEIFTYKFVVDKSGTYFYHGHFGMQRAAGLFGSLIVSLPPGEKEPFSYDGEFSLLLTDWYHKSIYLQELGLSSIPFEFVGEPQSLLIQGRGKYNCSLDLCPVGSPNCLQCNASANAACAAPFVLPVQPGKTYRLRLSSPAILSSLNFIIENHNMTVVEADSHYVEPFVVENLDIYPGQSYSVLITANQEPTRNYWVGLNVRGRLPATPTGLAVLQYLPSNSSSGLLLPPTPAPQSPVWNDFAVTVAQAEKYAAKTGLGYSAPPAKSHRLLIFLNTQNTIDGHIRWAINNISYVPTATPVLAAFKFKLWKAFEQTPPPDRPPPSDNHLDIYATPNANSSHARYGNGVYVFKLGDVVDVVIQNTNTLNPNNSEIHSWHLHGHSFWVLGYGKGVFDPQTDPAQKYNLVNPPLRNTVAVFPYGWVAIRFIADNPGAWPFHCHVEPHFFMGMGTVFAEGIHNLPHIPSQTLGCGLTKPNW